MCWPSPSRADPASPTATTFGLQWKPLPRLQLEDPRVVPLAQGENAPFAGQLLDPITAATLGKSVEYAEEVAHLRWTIDLGRASLVLEQQLAVERAEVDRLKFEAKWTREHPPQVEDLPWYQQTSVVGPLAYSAGVLTTVVLLFLVR